MTKNSEKSAIWVAGVRTRCERDFKAFVRYFFMHRKGSKFVFKEHHDKICDALMDVFHGRTTNLIINCPPRYSKTELVVILFSAWCFVKNSRSEFIHLSYSDQLVMDNSDAIKSIIKSAEFRQLWPGIGIQDNKDSKKAWGTTLGGSFLATAAGGAVTGFGAGRMDEGSGESFSFSGCLLIDDPLKPDDAHSVAMREAVNRRWDETIKSRRNSPATPTIVIMQRIHDHDFCGMLAEDSEHKWTVLKLAALVNEGEADEHALWPEKHDVAALRAMKQKNGYQFAGQYQQNPRPLGGGILKGHWFVRVPVLPIMKYRKIFADTAQKTAERNDYSVFQCWGIGADGRIYLIDMIRGKWEAHDLKRHALDFWAKHAAVNIPPLREMVVEDKASGTGLIQDIRANAKPRIPIRGLERVRDKLTRVMDVVPHIESGYVCIPEGVEWASAFIDECEAFTADDTHAHDDQIDPMCDAIVDMLVSGRPMKISAEALARV